VYAALVGYNNEVQAVESGCGFWQSFEIGITQGGPGLVATGLLVAGPFAGSGASAVSAVSGAETAPIALRTFSQSTVDNLVGEVDQPFNKNLSVGARSLAKKLGQQAPAFQGVAATDANASAIARGILDYPVYTVFGGNTYDIYNAAGQGIRFNVANNSFVGFLDRSAATR
jgi:hypothetical protein